MGASAVHAHRAESQEHPQQSRTESPEQITRTMAAHSMAFSICWSYISPPTTLDRSDDAKKSTPFNSSGCLPFDRRSDVLVFVYVADENQWSHDSTLWRRVPDRRVPPPATLLTGQR